MSGPPVYSKEQVLLHTGSQKQKRVRFRTRKIRYLQKINKKSEYPYGYSDGTSGETWTHDPLTPSQVRYQLRYTRIFVCAVPYRGQLDYISTSPNKMQAFF